MEEAVALFEEEEYAQCLLLLSALRDTAPSVEVNHLLLVCRIHSNAAAGDWNQVIAELFESLNKKTRVYSNG